MKLSLVIGGAEYLLRGLTPAFIAPILRAVDPEARLPRADWISGPKDAALHRDLFLSRSGEIIPLFLESLDDSYAPDDRVYVPLCFEPSIPIDDGRVALLDSRTERFFRLAAERYGADAVRCVRLRWSARTDAVLDALRARMRAAGLNDGDRPPESGSVVRVECVELESHALPRAIGDALWANYAESVLRRMGALLADKLPYDPVSFGRVFARRSQQAGLALRRDLQPSDVAEILDAGNLRSALALL